MTQSSGFYELRIEILHSGLTLILWHACMCVHACMRVCVCVCITAAIPSGARSLWPAGPDSGQWRVWGTQWSVAWGSGSPAHWLVGRLNTVTLVVLEAQRTEDQWSCVVLTKTAHSKLAEWGKSGLWHQKGKDFDIWNPLWPCTSSSIVSKSRLPLLWDGNSRNIRLCLRISRNNGDENASLVGSPQQVPFSERLGSIPVMTHFIMNYNYFLCLSASARPRAWAFYVHLPWASCISPTLCEAQSFVQPYRLQHWGRVKGQVFNRRSLLPTLLLSNFPAEDRADPVLWDLLESRRPTCSWKLLIRL